MSRIGHFIVLASGFEAFAVGKIHWRVELGLMRTILEDIFHGHRWFGKPLNALLSSEIALGRVPLIAP